MLMRFGCVDMGPRWSCMDLPRCVAVFFDTVETLSTKATDNGRQSVNLLCVFKPRPKFCITRHATMNVAISKIMASTAVGYVSE